MKNFFVIAALAALTLTSCKHKEKDYIALLSKEVSGFTESYDKLRTDTSLSEEQLEEKTNAELEKLRSSIAPVIEDGLNAHPDDSVGVAMIQAAVYFGLTDDEGILDMIGRLGPNASVDSDILKLSEYLKRTGRTMEGEEFIDFEVRQPGGRIARLSDYAGKGKPCLVDFWASWCAPCKEEIPNLRKIYDKYHKKINMVSVAVWDDVRASIDTAKAYGIEWDQIVGAGQIPTELYGIEGIPHIMLIDGDGVIVKRDLRGKEIEREIKRCL